MLIKTRYCIAISRREYWFRFEMRGFKSGYETYNSGLFNLSNTVLLEMLPPVSLLCLRDIDEAVLAQILNIILIILLASCSEIFARLHELGLAFNALSVLYLSITE